jgi:hypothetical protein
MMDLSLKQALVELDDKDRTTLHVCAQCFRPITSPVSIWQAGHYFCGWDCASQWCSEQHPPLDP